MMDGLTGPRLGELRSLTSLRGLAAMAVVLQHFSATAQSWCRVTIPSLVPHGYVAVDFFFVLSGFIMVYTYGETFARLGRRAFWPFLANRAARILPLNVFALACIMLLGAVCQATLGRPVVYASAHPAFDFAANLLLLHGLGIGANLNAPSWSISAEFPAYMLFPLFLGLLFGPAFLRRVSLAGAVAALFALALGTPHLLMTFEGPPLSLVRCFAEFMLGMGAFRLLWQPGAVAVLRRDGVTLGLSAAVAASLLLQRDLPAVLLFPLLVVAYATNEGRVARLVQVAPFRFLGEISFSLYLLHNPLRPLELELLRGITGEPVGPAAALGFAALGAVSVVPVAWLAYRAVERPGRVLLRGVLGGTRMRVPPAVTAPP